jgi:hypothetical protein
MLNASYPNHRHAPHPSPHPSSPPQVSALLSVNRPNFPFMTNPGKCLEQFDFRDTQLNKSSLTHTQTFINSKLPPPLPPLNSHPAPAQTRNPFS